MMTTPALHLGLENIAIAESKLSHVEGEKGELIYCGYLAEDLAKDHTFEDIAYLLWEGHLPSEAEAQAFRAALVAERELPGYIKDIIRKLPADLGDMAVLRTALSALPFTEPSWPPMIPQARILLAKAPTILGYWRCVRQGLPEREPRPDLGHAANYLYLLHGKTPDPSYARILDVYWMLSADHDMNASTFTARVVTSTQADMISAVCAAIGALWGPLHGGAPSHVDDMLDAIGTKENAEPWIRDRLSQGERLMGFGHRVYRTYDPRGAALKKVIQQFAKGNHLFELGLYVEEVAVRLLAEYKPDRELYPNLDFWAAAVLRTLQIPRELYTPTFCLSRIGGWTAQIMEQSAHNRLIRPTCIYVGPEPKRI
ncbi:MAG: citrate synthase/methylcitrate synthase [Gammaproteobacteria bacterium RIFCSPHIGHO2_12_FULL_45_9]|nr:MAG: citrate synthase/methylcitrate synthase [Gammaproteobacteria bacterium RIFCSPHIGHO2_12_FULL_45_9]